MKILRGVGVWLALGAAAVWAQSAFAQGFGGTQPDGLRVGGAKEGSGPAQTAKGSLGAAEAAHTKVSLAVQPVRPGVARVTLRTEHEKGWHSTAQGEVGATEVVWELPEGWRTVGAMSWPKAEVFELQGEKVKGYTGVVEATTEIRNSRLESGLGKQAGAPGDLKVGAKVSWVECGEGECIPREAETKFEIRDSKFEESTFSGQESGKVKEACCEGEKEENGQKNFVLAEGAGGTQGGFDQGRAGDSAKGGAVAPESRQGVGGWGLLAVAFAGGLVLNLMPCVFPVLGIKVLSFVKQAGGRRAEVVREAVAYALGIVASTCALGGVIVALRAGGEAVGWGFQLQDARVVWAMAVVMGLIAMNLAGGIALGSVGGGLAGRASGVRGWLGAFLSGVLMVAVATPCSAPFLAAALSGVFVLPAAQALGVMAVMGLGMAVPYVALAAWPEAVKRLPKPGAWMEEMKKIFAWLMGGSAAYLAWVYLGQVEEAQAALGGIFAAGAAMFGVWGAARWRGWARALAVVVLAIGVWNGFGVAENRESIRLRSSQISEKSPGIASARQEVENGGAGEQEKQGVDGLDSRFSIFDSQAVQWDVWDQGRVEELRKEGRTVVVEFTARWCVNCLINEKVVWGDARVREAVRAGRVVLMKADWTRRDARIAEELKRFGRVAVPLVVIYKGEAEPVALANLLTVEEVVGALR